MKTFRRIGVLTSGGDAPGMNAAIRAVTRAALDRGVEVMGVYRGYSGLIDGDIKPLGLRDVSNIINHGGTILYSDRCPEFKTEEGMQKAIATCRAMQIDGIVAIGGDGTFRGATDLTARGIPCIGLPGTIDNDITSTDATIGFDTAMNTVVEMVDRLRDTCESHARCNVVEVMGRDAGDIAIQTGIAKIKRDRIAGKRNFIVIVSEGVGPDFSQELAETIQAETGVETKFARLAHVVRGGTPSLRDRLMASRMGELAVDSLFAGKSNLVICEYKSEIVATDINFALILDRMYKGKLKPGDLDPYTEEQLADMRARCDRKAASIRALYETNNRLSL